MEAEGVKEHDKPQEKNGIQRAIFEEYIFLDRLHIGYRKLAKDDGSDAIANENQRYRKCEGECSQNAVNRECSVYHFQIKDFRNVRLGGSAGEERFLGFLRILFESVGNEKRS